MHLRFDRLASRLAVLAIGLSLFAPIASARIFDYSPPSTGPKLWVSFFNRFITVPAGWTIDKSGTTVTIKKTPTSQDASKHVITLTVIPQSKCSVTDIIDHLDKLAAGTTHTMRDVEHISIKGFGDGAFKWVQKLMSGDEVHWCAIPPHRVRVPEFSVLSSDTLSASIVTDNLLQQFVAHERMGRRRGY